MHDKGRYHSLIRAVEKRTGTTYFSWWLARTWGNCHVPTCPSSFNRRKIGGERSRQIDCSRSTSHPLLHPDGCIDGEGMEMLGNGCRSSCSGELSWTMGRSRRPGRAARLNRPMLRSTFDLQKKSHSLNLNIAHDTPGWGDAVACAGCDLSIGKLCS